MTEDSPGYTTRPFLTIRRAYTDVLDAGRRKRVIHGLIEVDVTRVRHMIRSAPADVSFTAYLIWAVARAVAADPIVHGYRQRRRIVVFDDVDVNAQIEVEQDGQKIVKPHIFRAANTRTVAELTAEMRDAQDAGDVPGRRTYRAGLAYASLPGVVRSAAMRLVAGNPFVFRRTGGTVGLSAIGMFAHGGWGIAIAPPTLMVTVGGITRKPRFVDAVLCDREMLALTLSFDHTVVDGAPAGRFAARLTDLIESASGLRDGWARGDGVRFG